MRGKMDVSKNTTMNQPTACALATCMTALRDLLVLFLQVDAAFEVSLCAIGGNVRDRNAAAGAARNNVEGLAWTHTTINSPVKVFDIHFVESNVIRGVRQEMGTEVHFLSSAQPVNELPARKQTPHGSISIKILYRLAELLHVYVSLLSWGWSHLVPFPLACRLLPKRHCWGGCSQRPALSKWRRNIR